VAVKHKPRFGLSLAALGAIAACGGGGGKGAGAQTPEPGEAEAIFAALEQRLLAADSLEVTARIESRGPVEAAVQGSLVIQGESILLGFEGHLDGKPVAMKLSADASRMTGGSGELTFEQERPPALDDGLVLGLTRMGLLHNLYVLSTGNPPQGTYGNAATWVTVSELTREEDAIAFAVTVDGVPSARAKLWLNTETGLPARREQTVSFDAGESSSQTSRTLRVVEDYESFSAD
jgi:hypothetical protein